MRASAIALALLGLLALSSAKVYFKETFDAGWENRWVKSKNKESEGTQGPWGWSAGKYYNDAEADKGLQTTTDARFYQISAEFPEFSNKGKDLVLQYSVKHEQNIDCGGGYIKILPAGLNQENFHGDDAYNVMFGPDICGSSTRKTHLIFSNKGKNHLVKKEIRAEFDTWTHLYTLVLHPDNTWEVYIDGAEVSRGNLKDDFDILPPRKIKDPAASKPADWVDARMIPDPEDKKPEGWDDIPKEIRDPDAKKPDDWDDDLDDEWEAPVIPNPEYKGEWKPRMIDNPAYKGEWVHPMIDNPDFVDDDNLYLFESNKYVGFELWQVKAGTIFDNIIITDDKAEADALAELTKKTQEGEKKMEEAQRATSTPETGEHAGHDHAGHDHDDL
jgi:calreticulin